MNDQPLSLCDQIDLDDDVITTVKPPYSFADEATAQTLDKKQLADDVITAKLIFDKAKRDFETAKNALHQELVMCPTYRDRREVVTSRGFRISLYREHEYQYSDYANLLKAHLDATMQLERDRQKDKAPTKCYRLMIFPIQETKPNSSKGAKTEPYIFSDYSEYLSSDHWKETRDRMCTKANNRCQKCGNSGRMHVHHKSYKNLWNEPESDLIVLCSGCHYDLHKDAILAAA